MEEEREGVNEAPAIKTVEVCGVPEKYQDEEVLMMFLEKAGGGVENLVLVAEEDKAVVTFEDPSGSCTNLSA